MWSSPGKTATQVIQEQDLGLVGDIAQLHNICQKVIDSHPDEVSVRIQTQRVTQGSFFSLKKTPFWAFCFKVHAIRNGNMKVVNKLMGLVQKETKGRADPVLVMELLKQKTS